MESRLRARTIESGVTGWIIESEEAGVEAIAQLDRIDRRACRAAFEQRFAAERMARDYVQIYEHLLRETRSDRSLRSPAHECDRRRARRVLHRRVHRWGRSPDETPQARRDVRGLRRLRRYHRESRPGLYHDGTRHLSALRLRLSGQRPFLLGSAPDSKSHVLGVDLTNPDISSAGAVVVPRGILHLRKTIVLWQATCFMRITITNHGQEPIPCSVELSFDNDFRDLFEIRGTQRAQRGTMLPVRGTEDGLILGYVGLDGVTRQTIIQVEPTPVLEQTSCHVSLNLMPNQPSDIVVTAGCARSRQTGALHAQFRDAMTDARAAIDVEDERLCSIATSSELFNQWIQRSRADLAMMVTETPARAVPVCGRSLVQHDLRPRRDPHRARGAVGQSGARARACCCSLAATQADEYDPARDAEPGKILHEMRERRDGGARRGAVRRATTAAWTRRRSSCCWRAATTIAPAISRPSSSSGRTSRRRSTWIDGDGDRDGDGFVEYARATERGLVQQGWKDSHDSVFHADGTLAEGADRALRGAGLRLRRAASRGRTRRGARRSQALPSDCSARPNSCTSAFEDRFWCEDLGAYALALDGRQTAVPGASRQTPASV